MDDETATNWIRNGETLARMLRRELLPSAPRTFLLSRRYSTTLPERRHPFVAAAFFAPRALIQYPDSSKNFMEDVVALTEVIEVMPARTLSYSEVESPVKKIDFLSSKVFGRPQRPTTFCSNLALMIEEQDGGSGSHLANEHLNVFSVLSKGDFPVVVEVFWKDNAWNIRAHVPDSESTFLVGTRIFSV